MAQLPLPLFVHIIIPAFIYSAQTDSRHNSSLSDHHVTMGGGKGGGGGRDNESGMMGGAKQYARASREGRGAAGSEPGRPGV